MMSRSATLSLFDLVCLGVNAIVGSGIYLFPGHLAQMLGPASCLAFVSSGGIALLVALCFAEVSSEFVRSGGPFVYAMCAFGRPTGYLVGWTCWAAALFSWAAVARALSEQLLSLIGTADPSPALITTCALGVTVTLGAINYVGLKPGAYTADVPTITKLVPLLSLVGVGLARIRRQRLSPFAPRGLQQLPRATFLAFFAFQGFEVVPVPAGESRRPRRDVPLAVIGSLVGATVLYVLVQVTALGTTDGIGGSAQPLSLMGGALLGSTGRTLVAIGAAISMLGFCAGVALSGPRYLEALAVDDLLPTCFAAHHPAHGTPHLAITATTCLTAVLIPLFNFGQLVDLAVLTVSVQYLVTCASLLPLRRRAAAVGSAPGGWRLPGGPIVSAAAALLVLWLMLGQLMQHAIGPVVVAFAGQLTAGLAALVLWKAWSKGCGR